MRFDENLPIYLQIMDYIKLKIIKKELVEGSKLPSVRDLSTELKVNPNTIQRSYQELEREGLVYSQRGMGTFVSQDRDVLIKLRDNTASNFVNKFIGDMKSLGYEIEDIIKIINQWEGDLD